MHKTIIALGLMLLLASSSQSAWVDTNFKYKQRITIFASQVPSTQSNFPVLITEADVDPAFFAHVEKSDLANMDIIFTGASEGSRLEREIVYFNSSGQLEAWVRIPTLSGSADTIIYMYYGYSGANEPDSTTTWSNNYAAVYHMQEAPTGSAGDVRDSTANGNHGTSTNLSTATGQIRNGLDFDGTDDYITVANHSSLQITGNLSLSVWLNMTNDELNDYDVPVSKKMNWDDGQGYYMDIHGQNNALAVVSSGASWLSTDIGDWTTNWHFACSTINATTARNFLDGTGYTTGTVNALVSGTQNLMIGRHANGAGELSGQLDEVRISTTNRSADWITTEYNNQSNPGNFYNVGSEISVITDRYRSVAPGATTALANGSGAATLTISGTTATFSASNPSNVGVGDAIQYDSDGNSSIDSIVFIHARTSNSVYTVYTANGAVPTPVAAETDWNIYRAYTSLANAEAGTENATINDTVENFDAGDRNCVTREEVMHFSCYANGTTADTGNLTWDGWTLDSTYYVRIFTPYLTSQVGIRQRHSGTWNTSAYHIIESNDDGITLADNAFRIEGLQIYVNATNGQDEVCLYVTGSTGTGTDVRISYCILRGINNSGNTFHGALQVWGADSGTVRIWNNIMYDFNNDPTSNAIYLDDGGFTVYAYNNTIYNAYNGIWRDSAGTMVAKNNIVHNATGDNAYRGNFTNSNNNISDDADAPGTGSYANTEVQFVNESGDDFHVSNSESLARTIGADLSGDANLPFSDDIDNAARTVLWCVGADENDNAVPTQTITPSATESATSTPSITITPTPSVTLTATESATVTNTLTRTPTQTITRTSTVTPSITPTPSITMTSTITQTSTVTPPWTHTVTPTVTSTATHSPTSTLTRTYTITRTHTVTQTITPTPTITVSMTITVTSTISPTSTITPLYVVPNDLDNVVIYPNPYRSDIKPEKEISFDRMPAQATIRLYNISGQLVTTVKKDSPVPWVRWDLKNDKGSHVASGVYIYIIQAGGQERRGKIAILQ